ncbi:hypothetical protein M434DRAFT_396268 [Hypoxylon sp. CO27-5]|nr:hypothetical protein M434DRAFT_396268 [Hypoxylon sp. CO27-5]
MDHTETKRWNFHMEIPQGKPRPKFVGEFEKHRVSGSGSVGDPAIMWLGNIPLNVEEKEANEGIVRWAVSSLDAITHIYIIYGTRFTKFVDRDGQRICIWNPDSGIHFHHGTTAADPHISLVTGTNEDNLVLYGYINVVVDEYGKPTGLARYRNPEHVVDGDDRILELFPYEEDQHYCAPYCQDDHEVLIDACKLARAQGCILHDTEGLLDHFCFRTRWNTGSYGDHFCPCRHNHKRLADHYCPCVHEIVRSNEQNYCWHEALWSDDDDHYCTSYTF